MNDFNDEVKKIWGKCAVTGCKQLDILQVVLIQLDAGHDYDNALPLIPNLAHLFLKGYITFDENLQMILSEKIAEDQWRYLLPLSIFEDSQEYAQEPKLLTPDDPKSIEVQELSQYLEYHRMSIYKN